MWADLRREKYGKWGNIATDILGVKKWKENKFYLQSSEQVWITREETRLEKWNYEEKLLDSKR